LSAHAVAATVSAPGGPQVQRTRTGEAFAGFPTALVVVALENPAGGTRFKGAVGDDIRASGRDDLHVIYQRFAGSQQRKVQLRGIGPTVIHPARGSHRDPLALCGFVAVGPVGREPTVGSRVAQLQAAAAATRPSAPAASGAVTHFVDRDMNDVGLE